MEHRRAMLDGFQRAWGAGWSLPELRSIEMYTRKKRMTPPTAVIPPTCPESAGALHALHLLETALAAQSAGFADETPSWQRYGQLPRRTLTERLTAEVFRLLRVVRIALEHPAGQWDTGDDAAFHFKCLDRRYPVDLRITPAGLRLLQSFVFFYLDAVDRPWGEAYVEAMLSAYYTDIVGELRGFEDEDREIYQFRPALRINRHLRLACANPRFSVADQRCQIELGPVHEDQARFPVDFLPADRGHPLHRPGRGPDRQRHCPERTGALENPRSSHARRS
ncbi:MAG: hypothetical protein HC889_19490 [Synechococcaceae cyanobacterium SM1_2_3]|nr:hypothetical protein [Synechococcaceae cyanobacterium SM1_2_3]